MYIVPRFRRGINPTVFTIGPRVAATTWVFFHLELGFIIGNISIPIYHKKTHINRHLK